MGKNFGACNIPLIDYPPESIFLEPLKMEKVLDNQDAYEKVVEAVRKETQYTAVILLAREEENALKFLCREEDSFLFHCALDENDTINGNKNKVRAHIVDTFEIDFTDIKEIVALNTKPMFTVKIISGKLQSVALVLYKVKLDWSVKEKILEREKTWKTIDAMAKNPKAMKSNYDVIEWLDRKRNYLSDSFVPESASLHVIWNITNKCSAGCKICATSDSNRMEVWPEDKLSILNALAAEKQRIKSIDFAGGDPCQDECTLQIIRSAVQIFGQNTVSVTTTSRGIRSVPPEMRDCILNSCELTFDASRSFLSSDKEEDSIRGIENYSYSNSEAIKDAADVIRHLTINIPILDDNLSETEIKVLVKKIEDIKKAYKQLIVSTVLIRLMPVGSHGATASPVEYKKYQPLATAHKIYKALKDCGIQCKYHCSLRILDKNLDADDNACTMLDRKIGIDCAGNVFACPWGGYLHNGKDITQNPFYIGNLLKTSLSEILSTNNSFSRRIRIKNSSTLKRNYCEVVSRFINPKSDLNNDPLAIEDDRS